MTLEPRRLFQRSRLFSVASAEFSVRANILGNRGIICSSMQPNFRRGFLYKTIYRTDGIFVASSRLSEIGAKCSTNLTPVRRCIKYGVVPERGTREYCRGSTEFLRKPVGRKRRRR